VDDRQSVDGTNAQLITSLFRQLRSAATRAHRADSGDKHHE
jgi:hypothetical protein